MKPKRLNESGTIFAIYSPKKVVIKPAQHFLLDTRADFEIRATLVGVLTVHISRIKTHQKKGYKTKELQNSYYRMKLLQESSLTIKTNCLDHSLYITKNTVR